MADDISITRAKATNQAGLAQLLEQLKEQCLELMSMDPQNGNFHFNFSVN